MSGGLTATAALALFGTLVVLAAIPGVSVLAVSARAAAGGLRHGLATTAGIVLGDLLFILAALFGLAVLADAMGELFVLVRYAGAAYLLWMGLTLLGAGPGRRGGEPAAAGSLLSSFLAGLFITLGDLKAIVFYLSFLPAFVDLGAVSGTEAGAVGLIALVAVGGTKLVYAFLGARLGARLGGAGRPARVLQVTAGGVMTGVGVALLVRG